jgi:hypothetical protein
MSNRRYYEARATGVCPLCSEPSAPFVYCATHRKAKRLALAIERAADRPGYNQYMREYLPSYRLSRLAGSHTHKSADGSVTAAEPESRAHVSTIEDPDVR